MSSSFLKEHSEMIEVKQHTTADNASSVARSDAHENRDRRGGSDSSPSEVIPQSSHAGVSRSNARIVPKSKRPVERSSPNVRQDILSDIPNGLKVDSRGASPCVLKKGTSSRVSQTPVYAIEEKENMSGLQEKPLAGGTPARSHPSCSDAPRSSHLMSRSEPAFAKNSQRLKIATRGMDVDTSVRRQTSDTTFRLSPLLPLNQDTSPSAQSHQTTDVSSLCTFIDPVETRLRQLSKQSCTTLARDRRAACRKQRESVRSARVPVSIRAQVRDPSDSSNKDRTAPVSPSHSISALKDRGSSSVSALTATEPAVQSSSRVASSFKLRNTSEADEPAHQTRQIIQSSSSDAKMTLIIARGRTLARDTSAKRSHLFVSSRGRISLPKRIPMDPEEEDKTEKKPTINEFGWEVDTNFPSPPLVTYPYPVEIVLTDGVPRLKLIIPASEPGDQDKIPELKIGEPAVPLQ